MLDVIHNDIRCQSCKHIGSINEYSVTNASLEEAAMIKCPNCGQEFELIAKVLEPPQDQQQPPQNQQQQAPQDQQQQQQQPPQNQQQQALPQQQQQNASYNEPVASLSEGLYDYYEQDDEDDDGDIDSEPGYADISPDLYEDDDGDIDSEPGYADISPDSYDDDDGDGEDDDEEPDDDAEESLFREAEAMFGDGEIDEVSRRIQRRMNREDNSLGGTIPNSEGNPMDTDSDDETPIGAGGDNSSNPWATTAGPDSKNPYSTGS